MPLLHELARVTYAKEEIVGEYDEGAQLWSTYAAISSLNELPPSSMSGASTTSAGNEDDTGT